MNDRTEALRICTSALRNLVDTESVYSNTDPEKSVSFTDLDRMNRDINNNGTIIRTNELRDEQIELQHRVYKSGIAIVDCGNCGETFLHETELEFITCPYCLKEQDLCDCPDHFYEGSRTIEDELKAYKSYYHICCYNRDGSVDRFPERFDTIEEARLYANNEDYSKYLIGEYITTVDSLQLWIADHSIKSEEEEPKEINIKIIIKVERV